MTYENTFDPTLVAPFTNMMYAVHSSHHKNNYVEGPRAWWVQLHRAHALHPVVEHILYKARVHPLNWHQLLLEFPYESVTDQTMIAYTRNDACGEKDLQTKTGIGKYLARHWPHVPDHVRRDWAGMHSNFKMEIWAGDVSKNIMGVELGPQSCMKSSYGGIPFDEDDNALMLEYINGNTQQEPSWNSHPYSVYAPVYGWEMAVRIHPSSPQLVMGRCLINRSEMVFVRSYARNPNGDQENSGSDEKLETWLRGQGFEKRGQWPEGVRFAKIDHPSESGFLMPYIDGHERTVTDAGGCLKLDCDGEYTCDNTNGTTTDNSPDYIGQCSDCGDTIEEGADYTYVGRHEETLVCSCCAENYSYARGHSTQGRSGYMIYYVPEEDCVQVGGEYYDKENLPDNIKLCADGEHRPVDACVYVDDWYAEDADEICYTESDGYQLVEECVCVDSTWYLKSDDYVTEQEDGTWVLTADIEDTQIDLFEETTTQGETA